MSVEVVPRRSGKERVAQEFKEWISDKVAEPKMLAPNTKLLKQIAKAYDLNEDLVYLENVLNHKRVQLFNAVRHVAEALALGLKESEEIERVVNEIAKDIINEVNRVLSKYRERG
jgi:hypothetical protein